MLTTIRVQIRRLPASDGLPLPAYMTAHAAGMDLHAAIAADVVIDPGRIVLIPTGLEVAIPVTRGMRIAQFVVAPVVQVAWDEVAELPATARGAQGFGHSGT